MAVIGRVVFCLFWLVLGAIFILARPGHVAPAAAYGARFIVIVLAIVIVFTMIRQRRRKFTAGWKRKDLTKRWS